MHQLMPDTASVLLPDTAVARGLLLAGGRSQRMGHDKRLLSVGGDPLVLRSFRLLEEVFGTPWVLVADQSDMDLLRPILGPSARFIPDSSPGAGPLFALRDALSILDRNTSFLLASDMPAMTAGFIRELDQLRRSLSPEPDILLPRSDGHEQFTCAFYSRRVRDRLSRSIENGCTSLHCFVARSGLRISSPEFPPQRPSSHRDIFHNLNTPQDHARFLKEKEEHEG